MKILKTTLPYHVLLTVLQHSNLPVFFTNQEQSTMTGADNLNNQDDKSSESAKEDS